MTLIAYRGTRPIIDPTAYVAADAVLIGAVTIGPGASVWHGCVLRADVQPITVGARTNVQDGTIVHGSSDGGPVTIGAGITIGHGAIVHGCVLEDGCFIGMRATILDGATIRSGAMVAAAATVTPGRIVPPGELWGGSPARLMRPMKPGEIARIPVSADHYVALAAEYR